VKCNRDAEGKIRTESVYNLKAGIGN